MGTRRESARRAPVARETASVGPRRTRDAAAALREGGQPLDRATRGYMESRFDHDFSRVRVHVDGQADQAAREVRARAYTVGDDVAFRAGQYRPDTDRGRALLAHELTHVVQQERAGAEATDGALAVSRPGDAAEAEAEATGARVAAGDAVAVQTAAPASVQREDDDSFLGDVWDFVTDDTLGGAIDFADAKGVGGMGTLGGLLGPLSVIGGGMDIYENVTEPGTFGLENLVDTARGAGNIFSGGVSTAVLAGLLPEVAGSTALSAIAAGGAGSLATAGGAVASAGLAGYGAGRLLDNGVDWIGDQISGNEEADHSISGGLADAALSVLGPEPGLWLADRLPSWLQ